MLSRGGSVAGALRRLVDNEGGYCSSDFDEDGDDEDVRRTPDKRQQSATPRTCTSPPACDVAAVPFPTWARWLAKTQRPSRAARSFTV
jgi:hypothetical protein